MYHELRKRGTSAADLKFLHRLRQTHFRNFKSKSGTRIINLLVPLCFRSSCQRVPQCITNFGSGALVPLLLPKFVSESAAIYHELRKRGTSHHRVVPDIGPHGTDRLNLKIAAQHESNGGAARARIIARSPPGLAKSGTVIKPERRRVAVPDLEKNRPNAETGETPQVKIEKPAGKTAAAPARGHRNRQNFRLAGGHAR